MNNIGEKIYRLRKKSGLSQEELGFEIDVSRQTVSKWELGTAIPEFKNLVALSKFFNVELEYFAPNEDEIAVNSNEKAETIKADNCNKPKKFIALKILLCISIILSFIIICLICFIIRSIIISLDDNLENVYFTFYSLSIIDVLIILCISLVVIVVVIVILVVLLHKRKKNIVNKN